MSSCGLTNSFDWWDAWADWRRSGYPKLTPVNYRGNVTNGTILKTSVPFFTEAAGNTKIMPLVLLKPDD